MRLGHRMRVDLRSASEWYAAYSGDYDGRLIEAVTPFMRRPGSITVDAGANVGFWTVPLAQRAARTGGRVIAAEPVPANARRLAENVELNRLDDHVEIVPVALSDRRRSMPIILRDDAGLGSPTGNAAAFIDDGADERLERIEVAAVTLDDLLAERGSPHVELIKADIEGHEDRFLAGALATLERCRPIMVVEWNRIYFERRNLDPGIAVGAIIAPLEYACLRRTRAGWIAEAAVFSPKPVDDLILAPAERAAEVLAQLAGDTGRSGTTAGRR